MIPIFGVLAGLSGALVGRALNVFAMGNGLFSSLVAVTGDAHQAQVAQDIFRADVQHELSLLVREDMRDVYALMCETVATQVTMGSICLGVCFGVFIEGYAYGAPTFILELWAMFTAWGILFTLTSLLLAMWFQMSIKNAVRERLLLKHRIFTPNDSVISSLGGSSLAEQVSRLHARIVAQLVNIATAAFSPPGAAGAWGSEQDLNEPESGPSEHDHESGNARATGSNFRSGAHGQSFGEGGDATAAADGRGEGGGRAGGVGSGGDFRGFGSELALDELANSEALGGGAPEADHLPTVRVSLLPEACPDCEEIQKLNGAHIVRARCNLQAWYDEDRHRILRHKIVELPGFLIGGALIRQPWRSDRLRPLRLKVYDEATLYVAARVKDPLFDENPEAAGAKQSSWTNMLELNREYKQWETDEMPKIAKGWYPGYKYFQRVEGFSIFVDSHQVHLPLYKLVLKVPEGETAPTEVEIRWRFSTTVEALTVILREGSVLTSEDEHPKRAFMQEVQVMSPLMVFAAHYIHCGTSCLLIAVLCMHCSRVLPVRPWPQCMGELCAMAAAASVAMVGIWSRVPINHGGRLFGMESDPEDDGEEAPSHDDSGHRCCGLCRGRRSRNKIRSIAEQLVVVPGASPTSVDSPTKTPSSRRSIITTKVSGIVSSKLWNKTHQTWRKLVAWSICLAVLFVFSLVTCLATAIARASQGSGSGVASALPERPWTAWPARFPPLLAPSAATFAGDGKTLWLASAYQLDALRRSGAATEAEPVGAPLRLPTATSGLSFVGGLLLAGGSDGLLRTFEPSAVLALLRASAGAGAGASLLAAGLSAQLAPAKGAPLALPAELLEAGGAIFAGAPEAQFWGLSSAAAASAPLGSGVLAAAPGAQHGDAGSVILYAASGLGSSSPGQPATQPLARLRPRLPTNIAATSAAEGSTYRALHLCVVGPCAAEEPRLWLALGGDGGELVAVGLTSGEVVSVPAPWPTDVGRRVVALTGNSTHLLALSESVASESPSVPEARVARYSDLLQGALGEL